jgi:lysophospholipase L1-like esterase
LSVLLFMAGAEIALRAVGWPTVDPQARFAHKEIYWKTDPNLRAEPTPHKELGVSFPLTTNADGLRAPLHEAARTPGVFRVMTLGCSTTFGWGVADDESYPARLEAILQAKGQQVEVINAGQPGYTSFQGLWLWRELLHRYKPDLVLIGYIVQDARKAAYSDLSQAILTGEQSFLKQSILWRSRLYLGVKVATGKVAVRAKEREEGGDEGEFRVAPPDYLMNLRALRGLIEEAGGRAMHFGYPLEVVGYTETHRRVLRLEAQSAGIAHFDPSEAIAEAARGRALFFPQDKGHANAEGNGLIAELVAQHLIENKLLGSP